MTWANVYRARQAVRRTTAYLRRRRQHRAQRRLRAHLGFQPDTLQHEVIHNDEARVIVCVWGRQAGKTTTACLWLYRRAEAMPNTYHWYVGTTYQAAQRAGWRKFAALLPKARIASINKSTQTIVLKNGSVIECVGAQVPDNLRGPSLHSVVLDEYGTMRREAWSQAISPMLAATGGHAMFIGTPNALVGAHFEDLYHDVHARRIASSALYHRTTIESPHIDPAVIDAARRVMRAWEFEQEYEARFVPLGGRVWPEYKDDLQPDGHVYPVAEGATQAPLPNGWECLCGIDFGATHQFAAIWIGVGPAGQIKVLAEYSSPRQRFSVHARELRRISQAYGGPEAVRFLGDPSAPQLVAEFEPEGIRVEPADNAVYAGIERIGRLLLHDMLAVAECCTFLRRGLVKYQWNPRISGGRMKPLKQDDDEVDAMRYAVMGADPPWDLSYDDAERKADEYATWDTDPWIDAIRGEG